jgi:hypothetical protein
LLRSDWIIEQENEDRCVIHDPIDYRGGPLRYTPPNDPEMQSVRALIGFLSEVCTRYGELTDALPVARAYSERIERRIDRIV